MKCFLKIAFYFPFGFGGLLPLLPPDGFPVVLGAFVGLDVVFAIIIYVIFP